MIKESLLVGAQILQMSGLCHGRSEDVARKSQYSSQVSSLRKEWNE
jgi:hypothetical protein